MEIESIAKVAHETNAAFCRSVGDMSQPEWSDAPEWQKTSAINGVNFHINNPNAHESASHNAWYAEKELNGWVYGEVKDPEAKTHPCMVSFEDLPDYQKAKDFLFKQTVRSLKDL